MAFSQDGVLRVVAKKFSSRKPWWQPLVNTSLISQFRQNVISFNLLANTLLLLSCNVVASTQINISLCIQLSKSLFIFKLLIKQYYFESILPLNPPCRKQTLQNSLFYNKVFKFLSLTQ